MIVKSRDNTIAKLVITSITIGYLILISFTLIRGLN